MPLLERLRKDHVEARRLWPLVWRRPGVRLLWVRSARTVFIASAAAVLLAVLLGYGTHHVVLPWLLPPQAVKRGGLAGLLGERRLQPHPWLGRARASSALGFGFGALGFSGFAFWLHVPTAVALASALARRRENAGDQLASSGDSAGSARAYQQALDLTLEADRIEVIDSKVERLGQTSAETVVGGIEGATIVPVDTPGAQSRPVNLGKPQLLLERYEILAEVAEGAAGVVYKAKDLRLDRTVALKALRMSSDSNETLRRFTDEGRALARLVHPNIVLVHDLFEEGGRPWMVLEWVPGGDLSERLKGGLLEQTIAYKILHGVVSALEYAHSEGIIHRDVKPLNVLVTDDGSAKVTDFGLAKFSGEVTQTLEGAVLGSPRYMSPEQASGRGADSRSDIYALGVTFFEVFTGQPPFEGDVASVLTQHITQQPPRPQNLCPALSQDLDSLIVEMLAKDPMERVPNMKQVRLRFEAVFGDMEPARPTE